ncbi:MBL fold metallo-hydrolase [soil metagenome]
MLPLPFEGLRLVNAYVLADESATILVDCGIHDPSAHRDHGWDEVAAALAACSLQPHDIDVVAITHPHVDHYGMAGRLVDATGCELWMHEGATAELDVYREPEAQSRQVRALLEAHGIASDHLPELTAFEDWRPYISSVVGASSYLSDGDSFEAGDREWTIVHTPGHSPSHICLWNERDRILISGDHLLPSVTPHIDLGPRAEDPLGDYLSSLERIERLGPELVLPGHGRPFDNGAERARATLRHHERRLGAIVQVIRRETRTATEISDEIFGTALLDFQKRLAMGEALAHLEYLERRDEIERRQRDDGVFVYTKRSRAGTADE